MTRPTNAAQVRADKIRDRRAAEITASFAALLATLPTVHPRPLSAAEVEAQDHDAHVGELRALEVEDVSDSDAAWCEMTRGVA